VILKVVILILNNSCDLKGCDSNFEVNILKVATNQTSTLH